jgi:hypothetical protein
MRCGLPLVNREVRVAGLADGARQLAELGARLKEAGETGLRRELQKAIRQAAEPVAREIKDAGHLRAYLPNTYADTLAADLVVRLIQRSTGNAVGVRIEAESGTKKRKLQQLDGGTLLHPLFGDRDHWYFQLRGVKAGFFTDPCEKSAPQVKDAITAAMHDVAMKIMGG